MVDITLEFAHWLPCHMISWLVEQKVLYKLTILIFLLIALIIIKNHIKGNTVKIWDTISGRLVHTFENIPEGMNNFFDKYKYMKFITFV